MISTKKNRKNYLAMKDNGFTLIELMMALGLLGLFMVILYGFLDYNFAFLQTHSDDQVESLELRKLAQRMAWEGSQYEEITEIEVDLGGGATGSAIVAVTSDTDLTMPPPGTGLIYYPAYPPPSGYAFCYDSDNDKVYYNGAIFAEGITSVNLHAEADLILFTITGKVKDTEATETQIITLPKVVAHWSKGG